MKVSRKAILSKTNYGVNIYAYVLRQYYPGTTVLQLKGRTCPATKNPFREDNPSLMVSIVEGVAQHYDSLDPDFKGNVFDFAELHFKLDGELLLVAIDEALNLSIDKPKGLYQCAEISHNKDSHIVPLKAPQCSFFSKPISNTTPSRKVDTVELYELIKGPLYIDITDTLRKIKDTKEASRYKSKHFDYATLSGSFSKRNDKSLLVHSGLMTIDFDHISNINGLKGLLLCDPYFETELLFTSPSGDGVKWVIPIDLTVDTHSNYFQAIANYIRQTYKVEIDQSGKDISRACFLPHDAEVYINPKYLKYEL